MIKEYIYFSDDEEPTYSSSDKPLKYENQTLCIVLEFQTERERDIMLNAIFPSETMAEEKEEHIYFSDYGE
jgi:hypothetical protein